MLLVIKDFKGTVPLRSKRLLPGDMAQTALNTKLLSGEIRPYRDSLRVDAPAKVGTKKKIHRWDARAKGDANGVITGATQGNPVRITSTGHGLQTGDDVYISGVVGMTQLNDRWYSIIVIDANNFDLIDTFGTELLTNPNAFDLWTQVNTVTTADDRKGWDGRKIADKITDDATNGQHYVYSLESATAGDLIACTVSLKADEMTSALVHLWTSTGGHVDYGTISVTDLVRGIGAASLGSGGVFKESDGFWRVELRTTTPLAIAEIAAGVYHQKGETYSGTGKSLWAFNASVRKYTPLDGTGFTAYTSGGVWVKRNGYFFHWTDDVDAVRSPIAGDTSERTIWTGDQNGLYPKVTDASLAIGSDAEYPSAHYRLGITKPLNKPSVKTVSVGNVINEITASVKVSGVVGPPRFTGPPAANTYSVAKRLDILKTPNTKDLETGDKVRIEDAIATEYLNDNEYDVTVPSGRVTNATQTNPVVIDSDVDFPVADALLGGDEIKITGMGGMTQLNDNTYIVGLITGVITGITKADPAVVTSAGHGLSTGDRVYISGVSGMFFINLRYYTITVIDANTFSLDGIDATSQLYGAYTSGGTWTAARKINLTVDGTAFTAFAYTGTWRQITRMYLDDTDGLGTKGTATFVNKLAGQNAVVTSPNHKLSNGELVSLYGVLGDTSGAVTQVLLGSYRITIIDGNSFSLYGTSAETWLHISGPFTNVVIGSGLWTITALNHGLSTGDEIRLYHSGIKYTVTVVDANTFTVPTIATSFSSYSGYWVRTSANIQKTNVLWFKRYDGNGQWTRRFDQTALISRAYYYTYVSGFGEEGPPSDPSDLVDVGEGQQVDVAGMDVAPTGPYNFTKKRIYRTNSGLTIGSDDYYFVVEVPVGSTTYADTIEDKDLGGIIPSEDWIAPPDDLHSIRLMENGIIAGLSKNDLYLCEPNLPHAWPAKYRKTLPNTGVVLGVFGNTAVAVTMAGPVLVSGNDPLNMAERNLQINQTCSNKKGMVSLGTFGVVYPSPDGLVMIGVNGWRIVTEGHMTRDEWQDLNPDSIEGYLWDDRYMGFYTKKDGSQGGFIFDPKRPETGLIFISTYATAGYNDPITDTLYLQVGAYIEAWEGGSGNQTYIWKSKEFETKRPAMWSVCQVIASDYTDLTLKLYRNGSLYVTKTITSEAPFRLPGGKRWRRTEAEPTGTSIVQVVLLAETVSELAKVA